MSLINEALKKAQQQRLGSGFHMSVGRLASASESGSNQSIMLKLVIGLIFMAVILGASLSVLFYGIWQEKTPENPPVAAATPITEPVAVATMPPTTQTPAPPVATLQPAQAAGADPNPIAESSIEPKPPSPPIAQSVTKSPPSEVNTSTSPPDVPAKSTGMELSATTPAATLPSVQPDPKPVPKPDKQVMAYIRMLNVNAVRMAGKDSKVFMNNEIFRLNSTINSELQIKILKINPKQIVFIDNAGIKYIKRF